MKAQHLKLLPLKRSGLKALVLFLLLSTAKLSRAQCPINIDFELGDFTGWQCWLGNVIDSLGNEVPTPKHHNVIHLNPSVPTAGRHTMLSSNPGDGNDFYGNFPQNCPNGSGHSIKLGNNTGGAQAEGVSYTFTIPAGQNNFSLIYHYAVVFQDPGHLPEQQPRLVIEIKNLTDNTTVGCSSFSFIATAGLPGFFPSPNPGGNVPVWCKNWSANTINLDGNAGKTIQLFFKTADCTFNAHFGYAYVDVNTECSSSFIGATFCPDDTAITVTAPYGYQAYKWWNAADPNNTVLSTSQTIHFVPPPAPGTTLKVEITPYAGYGCTDTLTAILQDTLTIQSNAGPDRLSCNKTPVQLGVIPKPGYVYSWSPATGLSNPNISNPVATPTTTTQYVVTTSHDGGGCVTTDTVIVYAAVLDSTIQLIGLDTYCMNDPQAAVLKVQPADSIQWYRNGVAIPGATQTTYSVTQSGSYHATVFSFVGCSSNTALKTITVNESPVAGFTVNSPANQCFKNNSFIFTNSSTITTGTLTYEWDLGDGTTSTSTDVTHSYSIAGTYIVKLIAVSDNGCADSLSFTVKVFDSPVAGFTANNNQQCFKNNRFIFTNTSTLSSGNLLYSWDLGDGTIVTTRDVTHSYALPGNYTVKLLVSTNDGCADSTTYNITVDPSPVAGFTVNNPQQCFTNNQFVYTNTTTITSGNIQYLWDLGDASTATTTNVTHNYTQPGNYTVRLIATSDKSCADTSTFNVKVFPYANADFTVQPVCININLPLINLTVNNTGTNLNYLWDFGNTQTSTAKNPVYSYPAPGRYTITLSINTNQCPLTVTKKQMDVLIDAPAQGINYPVKDAVINFPEPLEARQIGQTILWKPATNLDNRNSYKPTFRGMNPQLYTIELRTFTGCLTVDTQMVKVHKKIEIYVPTVFTPGSNGLNDYLRPLLMGFNHVNYFRVYDRWGKLLFQMQSDRPGWDGKVNNIPQEMQTVIWMIEAVDVDGKTHRKQGTTILMR